MAGFGGFRLPDRYGRCEHSIPDSCDDTSNNHLCDAIRGDLKDGSDNQDTAADHDGAFATEFVADED